MNPTRAAVALGGAAILAACDLPTEAPILEQRWILPVESTEISVEELLPDGVAVSGNAFTVEVDPFSTSESLQALCGACGALQGQTVPAPPFEGTITVTQELPADLVAAALASGAVAVAIENGFNFDPMAGGGSIEVTLRDGPDGRGLSQATFTGPMAPGTTVDLNLALAPGSVGSSLVATLVVDSPGGQTTTIDGTQRLHVTADPAPLRVTSASVDVSGETVTVDPVELDVEDIDSEVADRIQRGAFLLDVVNPFGVSLSLQAEITYPGGAITKNLTIGSGATSTVTLEYSGAELRSFLGQPGVRFGGTGTVAASAGTVTVTPTQRAVIDGRIDLTLRIGG